MAFLGTCSYGYGTEITEITLFRSYSLLYCKSHCVGNYLFALLPSSYRCLKNIGAY